MRILPLALALALAGCAGQSTTVTAANTVASAEVGLTAAEKLALIYEQSPSPNPAVVAQIKAADNTAYNAVKEAEAGDGTLNAALAAISALTKLVPVKGS